MRDHYRKMYRTFTDFERQELRQMTSLHHGVRDIQGEGFMLDFDPELGRGDEEWDF